jgi:hypothetical protein
MVRSALFYRLPNGTLIVVCKGFFPKRALPLVAKVGAIDVEGISLSPDGQNFTGILPRFPNTGDELVVRYLPEPPTHTRVRFPALPVA